MFGENLKKWRKQRNLTQAKLGEAVGVTGAYIQQLELGKKTNPSLEIVMKLCDALKIAPFDLDYDFSENEMFQCLMNESIREKRITYLKKLHQENPNDKKISNLIEKINSTGILSDEDIKIIDSYKECEWVNNFLGGDLSIIPGAENDAFDLFEKLLIALGYNKDEISRYNTYLFKKIKAQIELEIKLLKDEENK